jgi:hypothetical protein
MSIFRGLMCETVCFVLENMMATDTFLCVFTGLVILWFCALFPDMRHESAELARFLHLENLVVHENLLRGKYQDENLYIR